MTYKLHTDKPYWVKATFNEEMDKLRERTGDIYKDEGYYWITSTERDEILKVAGFTDGEDIITQLSDGRLEDFEDAEKQFEHTKIQDERPPFRH